MAKPKPAAAPSAAPAPPKAQQSSVTGRARAKPGDEVTYFRRYGLKGFQATVVQGENDAGEIVELRFDNGVRDATKRDIPFRVDGSTDESWAWPTE